MPDKDSRVTQINFHPVRWAVWIAAILLGLFVVAGIGTTIYTVEAESEGVVLRFGKFLETVEPGLHYKLPLGIDSVTVIPTRRQLKLQFGFATSGYPTNPIQAAQNPDQKKSMVTRNL